MGLLLCNFPRTAGIRWLHIHQEIDGRLCQSGFRSLLPYLIYISLMNHNKKHLRTSPLYFGVSHSPPLNLRNVVTASVTLGGFTTQLSVSFGIWVTFGLILLAVFSRLLVVCVWPVPCVPGYLNLPCSLFLLRSSWSPLCSNHVCLWSFWTWTSW